MLISELANELAREVNLRNQTFPRLIRDGRLSQGEADERQDRLGAALWLLRRVSLAAPRLAVSDLAAILDRAVINDSVAKNPSLTIIKGCE